MPNDNNLLITIITVVGGLIAGYLLNKTQIKIAEIRMGSKKTTKEKRAKGELIQTYEDILKQKDVLIKNISGDRDYWQTRAIHAERKLSKKN